MVWTFFKGFYKAHFKFVSSSNYLKCIFVLFIFYLPYTQSALCGPPFLLGPSGIAQLPTLFKRLWFQYRMRCTEFMAITHFQLLFQADLCIKAYIINKKTQVQDLCRCVSKCFMEIFNYI